MFKWIKSAKKLFTGESSDSSLVHIDDDGFMSENIAVSIEDIVADEDNDDIGKLHVLSLTEFHQALGETWEAREAKIFLLTESVLRNQVGPGNRWEHQSKEVYVMLFPTLSDLEAAARAYDIAEEVGMKIIGERFDGERRPLARIAGVDPKDAMNEDGTFNIDKLEQVGRDGESAGEEEAIDPGQDAAASGDPGADWKKRAHEHDDPNTDWKERAHDHDERDPNWHKQKHAHDETDTNWKERHLKAGPDEDPNWRKMGQKPGDEDSGPKWVSMDAKKSPCQPCAPAQPAKPTPKYSVSFAPCWDREHESLCIYKALLNYNAPGGKSLTGAKAYGGHKTAEQKLKIDLWVMQNTAKALFPLISKKIKTPVFVPLHSSSLRDGYREQFFEHLAKFTHDLRKGYLIVEILDDGQWDTNDLSDFTTRLNELCHGVAFRPHAGSGFKADLSNAVTWIGVDLSDLDAETGISPDQLEGLQKDAAGFDAKMYIFGLSQRAQLGDMLDMGVNLISGPALVRATNKLRPPFDLPAERLRK